MADAPAGSAVNPPPIGEALGAGWNAYKANWGAALLAYLCAWVVGLIPIIGGFLSIAGMCNVSLKLIRGQKPEPGDGFVAFNRGLVDHLVMGLLQAVGLLLCCIGVLFTQSVFYSGTFLIVDKGLTWQAAKDVCWTRVKPNFLSWLIFYFVVGLVGSLGAILCGVGLLVTLPIAMCAIAYAYEKSLGGATAKA